MTNSFKRKTGLLLWTIALCFCFSAGAAAQDETSATITGQVTDSNGAVVPNATVVIRNTGNGSERTVVTNEEGSYSVSPLTPGEYTVTVEQSGFKKYVQNLTLNAKDRRPVLIALEVGAATETVTVTSEPPLVQDSPTGQTLVSGNQVVELPLNNRNFIKLLETVPGISSDLDDESSFGLTSRASVSINGLRRNAVNYSVDGVSNTDVGSNITLLSTPTVDSIQEFKVLSSNYTAEVGRSGGGAVIIVTRGGGNKYSGTLYEFVRNDKFNANTFFNNRLGRNAADEPVAKTPKLRYNNFGGTFSGPLPFLNFGDGGPIWNDGKDKMFFFFSEEVRRIIRGTTEAGSSVPSALERTGNLSATLGLPLCLTPANAVTTNCAAPNTPLNATDTSGAVIQVRQNQVFRPTDNRPYAGNIIPTSNIDPRSLGLLAAFPLPNVPGSRNGFTFSPININNTRQEVIRIDRIINSLHRVFGRFTRDISETQESQGLFGPYSGLPNIATSNTSVPGKVLAINWTGVFSSSIVNEFSFNYSGNEILSDVIGTSLRSDYANAALIQQVPTPGFEENNANVIPTIATRFAQLGAFQGFSIEYANIGFRDVLTWTKGNHIFKFGGEYTREYKNENAGSNTQGSFGFSTIQSQGFNGTAVITGTGDSFGSFLLGRANTYAESQTDFRVHERFGRREIFAQDTWKIRPNLTLDFGVRYQFFVPPFDRDNRIGSFDAALFDRSRVTCANAACSAFTIATTNPNNGIGLAGSTSRFGRSVMDADYNNFSPRVGLAYSPAFEKGIGKMLFGGAGKSIIRLGYGFYYDQPLVGVFEQAAFTTPAFNQNLTFTSTAASTITFSNPNAGNPPGTLGNRTLISIDPNFKTPETQVWSLGIQREVFRNAVVDISYVGTKGDRLIRRRNINFVTPADTVAIGTANVNLARPFLGYGVITNVETSARSRYHGLLSSFNYRLSSGFTITLAYTFSKVLTDSTNDRDGLDDPQNPYNTRPEYAEARTSRPHIFSASYVYEIPFFKKSENFLTRLVLGGWQVAGITNFESGAPIPRVTVADTLTGVRGLYPNFTSDPNGGLAGTIDPVTGLPFIFDPTAFAPAANGQFGSSSRSFGRLPGRNQTNLAMSKKFYFNKENTMYLQIRAEATNLFNNTQFTIIGSTLPTAGPLSNTVFGRPTSTRPPREFQFGAKLYF